MLRQAAIAGVLEPVQIRKIGGFSLPDHDIAAVQANAQTFIVQVAAQVSGKDPTPLPL
jgi:hypothetical protein